MSITPSTAPASASASAVIPWPEEVSPVFNLSYMAGEVGGFMAMAAALAALFWRYRFLAWISLLCGIYALLDKKLIRPAGTSIITESISTLMLSTMGLITAYVGPAAATWRDFPASS